jgi:outer membrane protein assembly factor BamB
MQNAKKSFFICGPLLITTLLFGIKPCIGIFAAEFEDSLKGQWSQWRGPNGSGVSSEQNLPETWSSESQNIKWKVRIPGEGFSSPVVSNGRAILTTAYESSKLIISHKFVSTASFALASVFCGGCVISFLRKRREKTQQNVPPVRRGLTERLNRLFIGITTFSFVCVALVAAVTPQYFDLIFGKFDFLVSSLGGFHSHLLSMAKGAPAAVWLTSGGIALLGLAVVGGWLRAQSIWCPLWSILVFISAYLLVKFTPLDQWKLEIALHKKLIFTLPGLLVASWHILNCLKIQLKKGIEIRRFGNIRALLFVLLLTGLSALVFIPPNFTQSQLGVERVVVCVDMKSGNILWEQPVFIAPAERKHSENSYATPTPATDGRHIIVNFGLGVACLDFEGHILWSKRDPQYFENSRYAAVSSPLLVDDAVIMVQESEWNSKRPTWIALFEKATGRIRWKIYPLNIYICYTTPLLYQDGANTQLLISSRENVSSYDIESGERLWMQEIPMQNLVAGMARSGELLCIGGGTYGPKATIMTRLKGKGKDTKVDVLWQSSRGAPGCSSPVIYDDKLFTVNDTGIMTCYEVVSGTVLWKKRLKGRYLSSLVAGDGKIYACNTKGVTTVLAADSKLKVLAENDLRGRCYASPAIADGCILLRTANYLYCIEK